MCSALSEKQLSCFEKGDWETCLVKTFERPLKDLHSFLRISCVTIFIICHCVLPSCPICPQIPGVPQYSSVSRPASIPCRSSSISLPAQSPVNALHSPIRHSLRPPSPWPSIPCLIVSVHCVLRTASPPLPLVPTCGLQFSSPLPKAK